MKKCYRPPLLRFAVAFGIFCAALLAFLIAQKIAAQNDSQIAAFQKIIKSGVLADLPACQNAPLESAISALQKENPSFALQIEAAQSGAANVWQVALQVEIPPREKWAAWLENAAGKLPADVQFSTCVWQAAPRLLQCRAHFYRVECP